MGIKSSTFGTDIDAMVHISSHSRLAPTSRLYRGMAWGGLSVAAISMASLALFSIYYSLAGVFVEQGATPVTRVWLIGVVGLAAGAASSMLGFALGVRDESRLPASEATSRPNIAA